MNNFSEYFHCRLYDKETIINWNLPEKVKTQLGLDEYDYFFLATSKEDSHEGHKHVHFSIFPTKYNIINILEVEIPIIDPKILQKILKLIVKNNFDIITSTGTCKEKNKCFFGVFFSKSPESNTENLVSDVKKIKNVRSAKVANFTCEGYCEQ